MKTIILTALFSILFSNNTVLTTSIEGKVIDHASGEPILFAALALYKNGLLTMNVETDLDGNFMFSDFQPGKYDIEIMYLGYKTKRVTDVTCLAGQVRRLVIEMEVEGSLIEEVVITQYKVPLIEVDNTTTGTIITSNKISNLPKKNINAIKTNAAGVNSNGEISVRGARSNETATFIDGIRIPSNKIEGENNNLLFENHFINATIENTTTMSIDVDRASYSNVRSHLSRGHLPAPNDVRIEEMINYFDYTWKTNPKNEHPFVVFNELTSCPWNSNHLLLNLALKAKDLQQNKLASSNLVFLIDVSGSMEDAVKLPLLKQSMYLLIDQLREEDKISIVVYAGSSGTIIDGVSGQDKYTLKNAIENLSAGGSTAGASGIVQAYNLATKHFKQNGNNRVILATDGDFNVGISDDDGLVKLIEEKRKSNIYLSVLGFGTGNYQDGKMQKLSNAGNGNHFYIDNLEEAKKTLIKEFASTMYSVANDVKIQLEFNKDIVEEYKVIGYENRQLLNADFDNDVKDAGELGAGHVVTVIYEIIPRNIEIKKYDNNIATLKYRYKSDLGKKSVKDDLPIENKVIDIAAVHSNFQWAMAIAEFGLLLKNSAYKGDSTFKTLIERTESIEIIENDNYKIECISLMKKANELMKYQ